MQNKQNEKMRSLQDFAFARREESRKAQEVNTSIPSDNQEVPTNNRTPQNWIQSWQSAYQDVNRQLNDWYEQPATQADNQEQLEMESRIQELERQLAENRLPTGSWNLLKNPMRLQRNICPTDSLNRCNQWINTINLKKRLSRNLFR